MNEFQIVLAGPKYFQDFMKSDPSFVTNVDRSQIRVYKDMESIGTFDGKLIFIDPKVKTYGRRMISDKDLTTR